MHSRNRIWCIWRRSANIQVLRSVKVQEIFVENDFEYGWVFSRWRSVNNDSADVMMIPLLIALSIVLSLFIMCVLAGGS